MYQYVGPDHFPLKFSILRLHCLSWCSPRKAASLIVTVSGLCSFSDPDIVLVRASWSDRKEWCEVVILEERGQVGARKFAVKARQTKIW